MPCHKLCLLHLLQHKILVCCYLQRPTQSKYDGVTLRSRSLSFVASEATRLRDPIGDYTVRRDLDPPEEALRPDPCNEEDFQVDPSPFAFNPGQLTRLLNPRSLSALPALGGHRGLEKGLRMGRMAGLSVDEVALGGQASGSVRSVLPIDIGGKVHQALPDSKCYGNAMTEQKANELRLHVDRRAIKRQMFTNAVGKTFWSVGETVARFSFPDEPHKSYQLTFAVLARCAEPLVIGDVFLRATKIFTEFQHRLKKVASTVSRSWRLMYMDTIPRRRFGCTTDSEFVFADVDTGSEKDVASLEYTQLRGWDVQPLPSDKGYVQLADGSIERVCGFVETSRIRGRSALKRFYVLDGLRCDLILGEDLVDEIDLYNSHESSFVDLQGSENEADFWAIKWLEIDNRVETLLNDDAFAIPAQPDPQLLKFITSDKILGRFKRKLKSHNETDYVSNLLHHGLWTARERLENEELDSKRVCDMKRRTLTGVELDKLNAADEERQQRFRKKRNRIIEQKNNLMQWTS